MEAETNPATSNFGGCIRERASPRAWSGRFPCPDWPQPGVFARPTWPLECGAHGRGLARARGCSGSVCSRRNLPRCLSCVEATLAGSRVASGSHRRGLVKAVGTAPPRPARAGCDGPPAPRRLGAGKRGSIRNMQCGGGGAAEMADWADCGLTMPCRSNGLWTLVTPAGETICKWMGKSPPLAAPA